MPVVIEEVTLEPPSANEVRLAVKACAICHSAISAFQETGSISAALLACGVITGLGAVVHTARFRFGRSGVVVSCGGVGLSTVQGAKLAGATKAIAVDIESFKLEAAGNPISHGTREPSRASRLAEEMAQPTLLFRYGKTNSTMS